MFVYGESIVIFDACLLLQKEAFIYDIFCRVYELFGEACPYSKEEFFVEIYEASEQVKISVIALPAKDLQEGNVRKMVLVLDRAHVKFHFLLVRQGAEGPAPADTEEVLKLTLDLLDQKPLYPATFLPAAPSATGPSGWALRKRSGRTIKDTAIRIWIRRMPFRR